ncbi:MAG: hypothetical protein GY813_19260, partial [Halieaceae bacterium]|nr:hypothetical protein [Halieaceae bacterium]
LPVSELPQNDPGSSALSPANAQAERAEPEVMDIPQPTDVQDAPDPFRVEEKVPSDESMSARGGEQKSDTFSHRVSSAVVVSIVLLALLYVAYDVMPESFRSSVFAWFDLGRAEPGSALPVDPGAR